MAYCPFAELKLLPENYTQGRITPRQLIYHSAGGQGELYGWWMNPASNGLESHFWVGPELDPTGTNGKVSRIVQYMDTEVRADANGKANGRAISVETASTMHAAEPWGPSQMRAIRKLQAWILETHPTIRRRQIPSESASGIGWHVMFGAPGPWTSARGKVCPGPKRIEQVRTLIAEAVRGGTNTEPIATEGFLMALSDKEQRDLVNKVNGLDLRMRGISDQLVKAEVAASQRHGSLRGWLVAIAIKLYGAFGAARDVAVRHDPTSR